MITAIAYNGVIAVIPAMIRVETRYSMGGIPIDSNASTSSLIRIAPNCAVTPAPKVAANPKDHQARFDLALALNARDKREEAVDHLIAIIKADRKWNDDGARKQLLQFFEAWGPMDEHSVAGRRKLSGLLFS